ncbi:L-threonylcarbamoyladenylate synthase [Tsuneonella sp. YG55]|uniref:Threonylcarbamoyl-AMP synthase n=1 Tax=Tsuneonella litorea TaxID=2976475 RepID=A0A9X3A6Y7_9SPHN|nr:L-threonylcarbamoyladenylate synthase [Tsuneonella litorea]MCT2557851.1 L-threonylcarbamoyladenylate synthase [Tsuneonella litorea]
MGDKHATERLAGDAAGIARAAELLDSGGLVALPTETVYGLAGRADRTATVAAIYRAKGRPDFNPLIVHVPDVAAAERLARFDDRARAIAARFWPGPLTMVLPLAEGAPIAAAVTAGLPTMALRCPAHPVMRAVLEQAGLPLAAPSANRSGAVSPTSARHVLATLDGRIDAVLDGGAAEKGLESTIVALRDGGGWQLLREGPIGQPALAAILGPATPVSEARIEAPGQLAQHYSPGKPVRLEVVDARDDEFLLGFAAVAGDWSLSPSGDLAEAAARLYEGLHRAAASALPRVAVAPVPDAGLGRAINDRLRRAAS